MTIDFRYPIGKLLRQETFSLHERATAIEDIAGLPQKVRAAVHGLSENQLDTAYREGGWTLRQTVHHIADSHIQVTGRIRSAMTEDWPAILPYKEDLWAELADARTQPVAVSLDLLDALHARWAVLLRSFTNEDWTQRGYIHPTNGRQTLEHVALLYAWHGRHHTAQIVALRERMGW